jgi:hypothetical protein
MKNNKGDEKQSTTSNLFDDDSTIKKSNKHLTWYEYEIECFKRDKLKIIEDEKQFIIRPEFGQIIAQDGQIPNSIIRKTINLKK